jgi:hypothetical protein
MAWWWPLERVETCCLYKTIQQTQYISIYSSCVRWICIILLNSAALHCRMCHDYVVTKIREHGSGRGIFTYTKPPRKPQTSIPIATTPLPSKPTQNHGRTSTCLTRYSRVSFGDGSFYDDSLLRSLPSRPEHSRHVVHHCRNSSVLSVLSALLALFWCARVPYFSILVQFF